jgi:hypothetical protein
MQIETADLHSAATGEPVALVETKERFAGIKGKAAEFGDISHFKIPDSEEDAAVLCKQYGVDKSEFVVSINSKERKLYSAEKLAKAANPSSVLSADSRM